MQLILVGRVGVHLADSSSDGGRYVDHTLFSGDAVLYEDVFLYKVDGWRQEPKGAGDKAEDNVSLAHRCGVPSFNERSYA